MSFAYGLCAMEALIIVYMAFVIKTLIKRLDDAREEMLLVTIQRSPKMETFTEEDFK